MIPDKVKLMLEKHGLEAKEFEEGSTPTAVTAAEKLKVEVGQIAKSILFKGKDGRYFLFVCAGDIRIDSKKIKKLTGTNTRMARADELFEQTGFTPGQVCPFGVDGPEIFIDDSLMEYKAIFPAAGTDSSGVPTTYEQLKEIVQAKGCEIRKE